MSKNTIGAVIDITFDRNMYKTEQVVEGLKEKCNVEVGVNNVYAINDYNMVIVLHDIEGTGKDLYNEVMATKMASIKVKKYDEPIVEPKEESEDSAGDFGYVDPHILMEIYSRRKCSNESTLAHIRDLRKKIDEALNADKVNYITPGIKVTWCEQSQAVRISSKSHASIKAICLSIITSFYFKDQVSSMVIHDNSIMVKVYTDFNTFRYSLSRYLKSVKIIDETDIDKITSKEADASIKGTICEIPEHTLESFSNISSMIHLVLDGTIVIASSDTDVLMYIMRIVSDYTESNLPNISDELDLCDKDKRIDIITTYDSFSEAAKTFNYLKEVLK